MLILNGLLPLLLLTAITGTEASVSNRQLNLMVLERVQRDARRRSYSIRTTSHTVSFHFLDGEGVKRKTFNR